MNDPAIELWGRSLAGILRKSTAGFVTHCQTDGQVVMLLSWRSENQFGWMSLMPQPSIPKHRVTSNWTGASIQAQRDERNRRHPSEHQDALWSWEQLCRDSSRSLFFTHFFTPTMIAAPHWPAVPWINSIHISECWNFCQLTFTGTDLIPIFNLRGATVKVAFSTGESVRSNWMAILQATWLSRRIHCGNGYSGI